MDVQSGIAVGGLKERDIPFGLIAKTILFFITFISLVPLWPGLPTAGLDFSWMYAINEAVARHLVFGKDLIFTFGPLGSVYTTMYNPATDSIMLAGSVVLAAGFCAGMALLILNSNRPWMIVALPFLSAACLSRDAIPMFLPLSLLLVSLRLDETDGASIPLTRRTIAALVVLACAIGTVPLIKGSFSGAVVALSFLSVIVLIRARLAWLAVMLTAVALCSMGIAWVATGQPLLDLPHFFIAQKSIIAGYTDAMSSNGNGTLAIGWILTFFVVVTSFYRSIGRSSGFSGVSATAGVAAYLFIAFKAGFVRADGHVGISLCALQLIAVALIPMLPKRPAIVIGGLTVTFWIAVGAQYPQFSAKADIKSAAGALRTAVPGIEARMNGTLDLKYEASIRAMRASTPVPATQGGADIYPAELSILFANGIEWKGRPVLQSYSAYTPDLAILNRDRLRDAGPARIFFNVSAIDAHYPALEDGTSWPELLSDYKPAGFVGQYAILDKSSTPSTLNIGRKNLSTTIALGTSISLPEWGTPIWAEIDVEPTLLGRLVTALYKNPQLSLVVQYADGSAATYRFIPGMAKTGFVLSPTVADGHDFVALRSSPDALAAKRPIEFGILGERGTSWLWTKSAIVRLSSVDIAHY